MKTPDKSLARCRESKKRRNVCLTSQGRGGNKLHKEGHKQKCKGASERFIRSLWCAEGGLGRKWTPHQCPGAAETTAPPQASNRGIKRGRYLDHACPWNARTSQSSCPSESLGFPKEVTVQAASLPWLCPHDTRPLISRPCPIQSSLGGREKFSAVRMLLMRRWFLFCLLYFFGCTARHEGSFPIRD